MRRTRWRRVPLDLVREAWEKSAAECVDGAVQCQLATHDDGEHYAASSTTSARTGPRCGSAGLGGPRWSWSYCRTARWSPRGRTVRAAVCSPATPSSTPGASRCDSGPGEPTKQMSARPGDRAQRRSTRCQIEQVNWGARRCRQAQGRLTAVARSLTGKGRSVSSTKLTKQRRISVGSGDAPYNTCGASQTGHRVRARAEVSETSLRRRRDGPSARVRGPYKPSNPQAFRLANWVPVLRLGDPSP